MKKTKAGSQTLGSQTLGSQTLGSQTLGCLHCRTLLPPTSLFNGSFCEGCMELKHDKGRRPKVFAGDHSYHLRGARRCEIPGCKNHTDEGCFTGQFCSPCHDYIVGKSVGSSRNPSQAYQNELVKANFRALSSVRLQFVGSATLGSATTPADRALGAFAGVIRRAQENVARDRPSLADQELEALAKEIRECRRPFPEAFCKIVNDHLYRGKFGGR